MSPLATLYREVFEGIEAGAGGTWFVQGSEAILAAVDGLSAEQASTSPGGRSATIGAHVRHLMIYLRTFNSFMDGNPEKDDWPATWAKQTFTTEEWADLGRDVRKQYELGKHHIGSEAANPDPGIQTAAMANLAHAAYHLGAIRALISVMDFPL